MTGQVHGARPYAERVVDGDTQTVQLDLTPIAGALLTDIATALHKSKRVGQFLQLATETPGSQDRAAAMTAILQTLAAHSALLVPITPGAAEALAEDLDAASYALDHCVRDGCTNLADSPDGELCHGHHDAATLSRAV